MAETENRWVGLRITGMALSLAIAFGATPARADVPGGLERTRGWETIALDLAPPASALEAEAEAAPASDLETTLDEQLTAINRKRLTLMGYGMGTLVTWAVGNIAVGVVGNVVADDEETRAFHQGNWGWNVVNLVIGGIGLYNAVTGDPAKLDYRETKEAAEGAKLAFAINSVLDCVYMGTGAWLWERGLRTDEPVMTGWGQALVLQGGFLLAFDLVMWGLSLTVTSDVGELPVKLVPTLDGAAIAGRF